MSQRPTLPAARVTATISRLFAWFGGKNVQRLNVWIVVAACCLASPLSLAGNALTDIYNYYPLPEGLGSSGQPSPKQFADIRAAGFDVVLNLAMPTSENALAEEGRLVSETGMTYVHIPVPWEAPNAEHLKQFFAVVDAMRAQGQEVWVHCAANYRASAFVYKYLTLRQGLSPEQASTPLLAQWLPQMDENWRKIYDLSPADLEQP